MFCLPTTHRLLKSWSDLSKPGYLAETFSGRPGESAKTGLKFSECNRWLQLDGSLPIQMLRCLPEPLDVSSCPCSVAVFLTHAPREPLWCDMPVTDGTHLLPVCHTSRIPRKCLVTAPDTQNRLEQASGINRMVLAYRTLVFLCVIGDGGGIE